MENDHLDTWKLGERQYSSRLLHCFGCTKDDVISPETAVAFIQESGTEFLTLYTHVDLHTLKSIDDFPIGYSGLTFANIKNKLDVDHYTLLINTNHALSAEEAVHKSVYSANIVGKDTIIKLEVLTPDLKRPRNEEVLHAASNLIRKGYKVIALIDKYDRTIAKHLEELGCLALRVLLNDIGSGGGFHDVNFFERLVSEITIPVIVEGGIRTPDDVYVSISHGAAAALVNKALFCTKDPMVLMDAMKEATIAGRKSYLSKKTMENDKFK